MISNRKTVSMIHLQCCKQQKKQFNHYTSTVVNATILEIGYFTLTTFLTVIAYGCKLDKHAAAFKYSAAQALATQA